MSKLDSALKVVRLLGALVWLGVGIITLWGTWVAFRELGPSLKTFATILQGTNPQALEQQLQQYLPSRGGSLSP